MFSNKDVLEKLEQLDIRLNSLEEQLLKQLESAATKEHIEGVHDKFRELHDHLGALEAEKAFLGNWKNNVQELTKLTKEFGKRVNSLKTLEVGAAKKIDDRTKKSVDEKLRFLDEIHERYKDVQKNLSTVFKSTDKVSSHVEELVAISKQVKKADFELTKHAAKLKIDNDEIMRLRAENDKLKDIIAKQRRTPGPQF